MKQKIKFFIIFYFAFTLSGLLSCEKCGKDGPVIINMQVTDVTAKSQKYERGVMNNQVSLNTLVDIDNVAIRFNEFVVNVTPVKRELSLASLKTPYKSGILPATYACSLARFFKTVNQLEGIKIYADRPFNSTISTQTDLADFFDVVVLTNEESSQKTERFDLKTYLDKKAQVPDHLLLVLKKSPEKTDVFKFTVELTLTDSVVNKFNFAHSPVEIIAE